MGRHRAAGLPRRCRLAERAAWDELNQAVGRPPQVLVLRVGRASPNVLVAARDTALNPAITEAFALAIIAPAGPPAHLGMPGASPDLAVAHRNAAAITAAAGVLRELVPGAGSYVSEASYADPDWHRAASVGTTRACSPSSVAMIRMAVHHPPRRGSEEWTANGFTRI
jgi:hypothetical protein